MNVNFKQSWIKIWMTLKVKSFCFKVIVWSQYYGVVSRVWVSTGARQDGSTWQSAHSTVQTERHRICDQSLDTTNMSHFSASIMFFKIVDRNIHNKNKIVILIVESRQRQRNNHTIIEYEQWICKINYCSFLFLKIF